MLGVVIFLSFLSLSLLILLLATQLRTKRMYIKKLKAWGAMSPYEKLTGSPIKPSNLSLKEIVEQYVAQGGRLNDIVNGAPVMFNLMMQGHFGIAKEFVEQGADPNTMTEQGMTVYFMLNNTPNKTKGQNDLIATLINKGANRALVPQHYDNLEVRAAYDAGDYIIAQAISKALADQ